MFVKSTLDYEASTPSKNHPKISQHSSRLLDLHEQVTNGGANLLSVGMRGLVVFSDATSLLRVLLIRCIAAGDTFVLSQSDLVIITKEQSTRIFFQAGLGGPRPRCSLHGRDLEPWWHDPDNSLAGKSVRRVRE